MHDPALGRFGAVDPLSEKYMYNSGYAFAENRLVDGVELEGLEWRNSTREEVESYISNGNLVNTGEVGYVRAVGQGEGGYYTFVGETQYRTSCDVSGNQCNEPITFNSKAFYSGYNNRMEILHRNGAVLTFEPNSSGMIELPSSGQAVTGSGTLGTFSIGTEQIYSYYNRNDVASGPSDQWAEPMVMVGLLNSIFSYRDLYPNDLLHIGDMKSPTNGTVNVNSTKTHHSNRGAIDIRYIGNNGGSYQGQYNNSQFSASRNRDFIYFMGQNGFSRAIVAPGIRTQVTSFGIQVDGDSRGKHNDHMHFDIN